MSAVKRALEAEIAKLQKRLGRLRAIINANPVGRIIEIRQEANKIIDEHGRDYVTIAQLIDPLAKEEKQMFALAEKQRNLPAMIEEEVNIEMEVDQLNSKLHFEKWRGKATQ